MDYSRRHRLIWLIILIFPYIIILYSYITRSPSPSSSPPSPSASPSTDSRSTSQKEFGLAELHKNEKVLLIYVWANTDVQALGNLQYFVRHAVHRSQPVDYYFILQNVNNTTVNISSLPTLPPNAHYLQHENECYDFGTYGWFLSQTIVNIQLYKYFIFLNASIRGPYFANYVADLYLWWFTVFTRLLNQEVKLVGCTINCEHKPHVQSYLLVTDKVGLSILNNEKSGIFTCKKDYGDAVFNGEIGASQIILHHKYQIASLQTKYQGLDFRKKENWYCNNKMSPIFIDRSVDGITPDPYELVFVKYKGRFPFDSDMERRGMVYQKWLEEQPFWKNQLKS